MKTLFKSKAFIRILAICLVLSLSVVGQAVQASGGGDGDGDGDGSTARSLARTASSTCSGSRPEEAASTSRRARANPSCRKKNSSKIRR